LKADELFFLLSSTITLDFPICCDESKNTHHILYLWTSVVLVVSGKQLLGLFPVEAEEKKLVWLRSVLWRSKAGMCVKLGNFNPLLAMLLSSQFFICCTVTVKVKMVEGNAL